MITVGVPSYSLHLITEPEPIRTTLRLLYYKLRQWTQPILKTSNVLSYHNHIASYLFSVFPEDISPCRLPFMLKAIQDIVL